MVSDNFKAIASVLRDHFPDTYALLNVTAAVEAALPSTGPDHEDLVAYAANHDGIRQSLREGKRIQAIKDLRAYRPCTLKAAVDALKDPRVAQYYNPLS